MKPGESWAYRQRGIDPLVEVKIVREGTQRPARVLIRFVDDAFEGKEEWVPPARLKVRWDEVDEFRAHEERWARVSALGPDHRDPRTDAVIEILDRFMDQSVADYNFREGYSLTIHRPQELAEMLGLREEQLTDYPESFAEDGAVIAPWPATELVASTAARLNADQVLRRVQAEERKAQRDVIYGYRDRGTHISPEIVQEAEPEAAAIRETLRSWCGVENVRRFDELTELRKEIKRVGDVAQSAIDQLRKHGYEAVAVDLERELGTPVEMLRDVESD